MAALDERNKRLSVIRDRVYGVTSGRQNGFYLFGRPGTSKTHAVIREERNIPYVLHAGHLTPLPGKKPRRILFFTSRKRTERLAIRHCHPKTPLCFGNRPGTNRQAESKRHVGEHYDPDSYRRAIKRAVAAVNRHRQQHSHGQPVALLKPWSPNQLRHAAATDIRRRFGLEAAQVVLLSPRSQMGSWLVPKIPIFTQSATVPMAH